MTFAEKIKSLRKERGLTQIQLAQAANMSLGVIADVESGRRTPSKQVAKSLAEFFHVPVQTFIIEDCPLEKTEKECQEVDFSRLIETLNKLQEALKKYEKDTDPEKLTKFLKYFYNEKITDKTEIERFMSFSEQTKNDEPEALAH